MALDRLDGEASLDSHTRYGHNPTGADLKVAVSLSYAELVDLIEDLDEATAVELAKGILDGNVEAITELVSGLGTPDQFDVGYEILDNLSPGELDDLVGEFSEHHMERASIRNEIKEMGK